MTQILPSHCFLSVPTHLLLLVIPLPTHLLLFGLPTYYFRQPPCGPVNKHVLSVVHFLSFPLDDNVQYAEYAITPLHECQQKAAISLRHI